MADVTIYHNPRCSTSKAAVETVRDAGVDAEIVQYLKTPLDEDALRTLIGQLQDPVTDLVRRDAYFKELGLTGADVTETEQVIQVLLEHPRLMQRPVLVKGDQAIIGRPKDRVPAFVAG